MVADRYLISSVWTENSLTTSQTLPFTIEAIEALLLLHNSCEVKQSTRATNSTDQDRFYLVVAIKTPGGGGLPYESDGDAHRLA